MRRSIALGISLALALPVGLASTPTMAGSSWGPAEAAATPEAEDPGVVQARALYEEGKARFDLFDYEGAIELWTQAFSKLPEDEASVRNSMVYNIATAREKAFEANGDIQHLRMAVKLLQSYIDNYKALYEKSPEATAEVSKAEERIATLEERIAQAEQGDTRPPPPVDGEAGGTVIGWNDHSAPAADPELLARNQRLSKEESKTDKMLIASYVTLSVGGLFTLAGTAAVFGANAVDSAEEMTMIDPTEAETQRTEAARGSGYGMLALGLAGLVTGATLLGVGLDRRKKAKKGTLVSGAPVLGPRFAGASVHVRF